MSKQVQLTESFRVNVQGTLDARFQLDADGRPVQEEDDEGHFYFINLRLKSPQRNKIDKVTYLLDASYTVSSRFSKDGDTDFLAEITAYGDYVLTVKIQMGKHLYVEKAWLSALLEAGHAGEAVTGPIRDAIDDIKAN